MKKSLFGAMGSVALAASMMFVSCTSNEIIEQNQADVKVPIKVNVYATGKTRASEVNNVAAIAGDIQLHVYQAVNDSTVKDIAWDGQTALYNIDGATGDITLYTDATKNEKATWPVDGSTLKFIAYYNNNYEDVEYSQGENGDLKLTGNDVVKTTIDRVPDVDALVGYAEASIANATAGVTIELKHIYSQAAFEFKVPATATNCTYDISSVELKAEATNDFASIYSINATPSWTILPEQIPDVEAGPVIIDSSDDVSLTTTVSKSLDSAFFLPAAYTLTIYYSVYTIGEASGAKVYIDGSETQPISASVEITTEQAVKQNYVITLPEPGASEIKAKVSVAAWTAPTTINKNAE